LVVGIRDVDDPENDLRLGPTGPSAVRLTARRRGSSSVTSRELILRSRNNATDELTMNPGRAIFRGSFVSTSIRKGLRAFRLSAAGRESVRPIADSPTPPLHRSRRAESSLFLSLTDPIQLALRVALDREQQSVNQRRM
jgi:hypothetical protein